MEEFIEKIFKKYDFNLTDKQIKNFNIYLNELKIANESFNITAITDDNEIVLKHFLDSVMISKFFDFNKIETLIDVGTGGGFPGLPLKILFPHLKVTLLDSLNKRVNFLNNLISKLELKNILAVHGRSEDYGKNEDYREKYDLVTSRAVAYLNTLSEYCVPFVKENGYFIPLKKSELQEELEISKNSIEILGGNIEKIEDYKIEELENSHSLVFIKKINKTSNEYPRNSNQIKKKPL